MPTFIKKQTITPSSLDETSVQPIEKESLISDDLEKGIHFFNGRCEVRAANRLELRQKAYEYVYEVYSNKGYTKNESSNLWLSIYDALPDTTTLIAEDENGNIGGVLTIVFDSPIGLPADSLYKEEIDRLRNAGRQISEIISFGIKKPKGDLVKILAGLFYSAYLFSWRAQKQTDLVITVNPRHEKYYCRNIVFKKIGPLRNYARVNGAPAVLLNLSLMDISRMVDKNRIFPFSMLNYSDKEELEFTKKIENMLCPMSDEEFFTFFIEKTDTWEKATPVQKKYLKKITDIHGADHFSISRALAKSISRKLQTTDDTKNYETKMIKGRHD